MSVNTQQATTTKKKTHPLISLALAAVVMLLVTGVMHLLGFTPEQLKSGLTAGTIVLAFHLATYVFTLHLSKKKDKAN